MYVCEIHIYGSVLQSHVLNHTIPESHPSTAQNCKDAKQRRNMADARKSKNANLETQPRQSVNAHDEKDSAFISQAKLPIFSQNSSESFQHCDKSSLCLDQPTLAEALKRTYWRGEQKVYRKTIYYFIAILQEKVNGNLGLEFGTEKIWKSN